MQLEVRLDSRQSLAVESHNRTEGVLRYRRSLPLPRVGCGCEGLLPVPFMMLWARLDADNLIVTSEGSESTWMRELSTATPASGESHRGASGWVAGNKIIGGEIWVIRQLVVIFIESIDTR